MKNKMMLLGIALAATTGFGAMADDIVIIGVFMGPGAECPQFQMESGETISLSGQVPDHQVGDQGTLVGRWAMMSKCMQGREFYVTKTEQNQ